MANPITQADAGSSLAKLYDTVGSQSGGPNAEIEADRILLVQEMGNVLASERYFNSQRVITSGAIAQSTNWSATFTGLSNGPARLTHVALWIPATGLLADIAQATLSLRNSDQASPTDTPIFAWDAATGIGLSTRVTEGGTTGTRILLLNQLPYSEPLINGNSAGPGAASTLDSLVFQGTMAAFGGGSRTVSGVIRVCSMLSAAGVNNSGSYGLPIHW